jgi:glycosyltransferase involved in cell wall biosynthesis
MHIVIDARIINSSTGRYVERLVYYLQEVDTVNTYTILVPTKDLQFITLRSANFTLKAADFKNYSFEEQTKFKTLLDSLHGDLVHFCMPQQPLLYAGKKVTTIHDLNLLKTYNSDKNWLIFHSKQLVGRYLFKRIAKTNEHIIVPTQFVKKEYMNYSHIPENKITQSYEAADMSDSTLVPYLHPFKRFILYVGQQSDYKNIARLGDAHQKLLTTHPDLGLLLVGRKNASVHKNEAYFAKNNYKNILFTDFLDDAQRDWLYTQTAAYVFPSLMEGFGLPALEAMSYGAPVVSSNATCLPEVCEDAAHYFDPTSVDDMERAINDVISNDVLRTDLINKGYEQIKKYSWLKMAQQTHEVYLNALK